MNLTISKVADHESDIRFSIGIMLLCLYRVCIVLHKPLSIILSALQTKAFLNNLL